MRNGLCVDIAIISQYQGKKIQWGMPGGIPTARRAFYVGSVGYKTN
jgi:hypothetical protein